MSGIGGVSGISGISGISASDISAVPSFRVDAPAPVFHSEPNREFQT